MKLRNTILEGFGGFKLDTSKIGLRSVDSKNVKLSYTGDLPDALRETENAVIHFNVKPWQAARAVLVVKYNDGGKERFLLDATADELKAILDRFFFNPNGGTRFDCGLDPYWLGIHQADYIGWRKLKGKPANKKSSPKLSLTEKNELGKRVQQIEPPGMLF